MSKKLKILIIGLSVLIIASIYIVSKSNSIKSTETSKTVNSSSHKQYSEIDSILKTRKYQLIEGKEYIQYELPYSTNEIMKNTKLMLQLRDLLVDENTFFTMLKLNDGNGVLVQTEFQSLTIGDLGDEFCTINNVLYNGHVNKEDIVYYDIKGNLISNT
ncbi:hypothetical protein C671_3383 [[Clostridium] bifermentans ATCC 19299]|uniref:hypothetical protein n=1 Tax=Paraclostridium bifermentans TaxID=1490 RepID=UPI00038C80FD|nr:hypothetical protein [Paraclostridium bifermentans]EQK38333.1 hypothetical protein C671_3383 [[Clostridium] bifermentans ATCC 19299] [Paraclostridium bifermentans ATCC 19299]